jgi:hypothetical protein
MLLQSNEQRAEELMQQAQEDARRRWTLSQQMAQMHVNGRGNGQPEES